MGRNWVPPTAGYKRSIFLHLKIKTGKKVGVGTTSSSNNMSLANHNNCYEDTPTASTRRFPKQTVQDRPSHGCRPIKKTPVTKTQLQRQMQNDSNQHRPNKKEKATICNLEIKIVCYFRLLLKENLGKWMDHLLILTPLPGAKLLNCLGWSTPTQTLPFNPLTKTPEKWKDHMLILTLLPSAEKLDCLELPLSTQTGSFNHVLSYYLVVWVDHSELSKNLKVKGVSLLYCNPKVGLCNV